MRIKKILSMHRRDFVATMECEHCNVMQQLKTGYDDANYHDNVIPKMVCPQCRKNRAGDVIEEIK